MFSEKETYHSWLELPKVVPDLVHGAGGAVPAASRLISGASSVGPRKALLCLYHPHGHEQTMERITRQQPSPLLARIWAVRRVRSVVDSAEILRPASLN